ncbi:MAG: hypothetical protein MJZ86_10180 [Bacteroidales bacterium]|nr:hypothetical protein [Bacteroidales bacterium]
MFSNGVYIWDTNGHDIGFISIGTESGERQCPQAAYLLTLVTQDGHRHTVRLLKQSEVFGN